ncbi:MAG TPA: SRPBCC domain-containing protein [Acidimicrobiales bacterium]|nr:SRPBCC domain-containing protein [Acidimicrobiales bacterium]
MSERTVTCSTFTIERNLAASPNQVFAAFADVNLKTRMLAPSNDGEVGEAFAHAEFDFRIGGRERFEFVEEDGRKMKYDALYYDIVSNQRIVYSYEMYADGSRISVSVASIEFLETTAATTLIWTEQGAFLDGLDTSELREGGTSWMINNMAEYFDARSSPDSR